MTVNVLRVSNLTSAGKIAAGGEGLEKRLRRFSSTHDACDRPLPLPPSASRWSGIMDINLNPNYCGRSDTQNIYGREILHQYVHSATYRPESQAHDSAGITRFIIGEKQNIKSVISRKLCICDGNVILEKCLKIVHLTHICDWKYQILWGTETQYLP